MEKKRRYLDYVVESYQALSALYERNKELPEDPADPRVELPCMLIHAPESVPVDVKFIGGSRKVRKNVDL